MLTQTGSSADEGMNDHSRIRGNLQESASKQKQLMCWIEQQLRAWRYVRVPAQAQEWLRQRRRFTKTLCDLAG